jgi:hypothetical protein
MGQLAVAYPFEARKCRVKRASIGPTNRWISLGAQLTRALFPPEVAEGEYPMRYKSFRIQNFKGIKDTTVNLDSVAGAAVFAFVGLNESGKTTVLEAIHSFSPDAATSELIGDDEETGVPFKDRVPRHLISTFSGDVSVTATVSITEDDKRNVAKSFLDDHDLQVDVDNFPDEIVFERHQRFENGDFKKSFFSLRSSLQVKSAKQRRWRTPTVEEKVQLRDAIYDLTPELLIFRRLFLIFQKRYF